MRHRGYTSAGNYQYRQRARARYVIYEADIPVVEEFGLELRHEPVRRPVRRIRVRSPTAQGEKHTTGRTWPWSLLLLPIARKVWRHTSRSYGGESTSSEE